MDNAARWPHETAYRVLGEPTPGRLISNSSAVLVVFLNHLMRTFRTITLEFH